MLQKLFSQQRLKKVQKKQQILMTTAMKFWKQLEKSSLKKKLKNLSKKKLIHSKKLRKRKKMIRKLEFWSKGR